MTRPTMQVDGKDVPMDDATFGRYVADCTIAQQSPIDAIGRANADAMVRRKANTLWAAGRQAESLRLLMSKGLA